MTELLKIDNLSIAFGHPGARVPVVHGVSLSMRAGEKFALVGESGSGKSVTALSLLQLHDRSQCEYPSGSVQFDGRELIGMPEPQLRALRGREIAMIFQEPMISLNPVYTIGDQLVEPLMLHEGLSREQARARMIALLGRVGIVEPEKRFDAFPHMLSGGQRQRVMIAMALACKPKLLIADEPTTALDVTIQRQILDLLDALQGEFNMAVLLITHDLNMVRHFADSVAVMEQGQIVEHGPVAQVFAQAEHAYTRKLLASEPEPLTSGDDLAAMQAQSPLLEGDTLRCYFPIKAGFFRRKVGEVRAVDQVSIALHPGETVGIVGESGSGKSTLGMSLLRLQDSEGPIRFLAQRLDGMHSKQLRPLRRHMQVVFQDPYSSLSPRMNVEQIIGEGLQLHFPELSPAQRRERIIAMMQEVGLDAAMLQRYPHEFSGGQRQRIAIARAVILEPKLLLLDEPTSALDISVQKQVLVLLRQLQLRHGMSYLFISHDLKVIRAIAHRVLVMKDGQVVEQGETEAVFAAPQQDYTRRLLAAALWSEVG
ncbi:MAG: ABC transporter ATP-binding protein [Chromatiales bacterium]|nr:ABC transporter ATP-binding protein [Gammaproteobacteria bacterium]MBW6475890.1 ABC transporter ATP-binding protein [Chromatiales bacterium]